LFDEAWFIEPASAVTNVCSMDDGAGGAFIQLSNCVIVYNAGGWVETITSTLSSCPCDGTLTFKFRVTNLLNRLDTAEITATSMITMKPSA
jgi:hypothetical protein